MTLTECCTLSATSCLDSSCRVFCFKPTWASCLKGFWYLGADDGAPAEESGAFGTKADLVGEVGDVGQVAVDDFTTRLIVELGADCGMVWGETGVDKVGVKEKLLECSRRLCHTKSKRMELSDFICFVHF